MEHSMSATCSACKGGKCMYAEGGEAQPMEQDMGDDESMDNELMDGACEELMKAIESKNKKEMLESLKAIILSCRG